MSRLFGDMRQVGIVVRDIEAAMRHWRSAASDPGSTLTAWRSLPLPGRRYEDAHISIALATQETFSLD